MLDSVARIVDPDKRITLFLLLQNLDAIQLKASIQLPSFVIPLVTPDIISLSSARNILLSAAIEADVLDNTSLVSFPDDDCWYPGGVLEGIGALFKADPHLEFAFCHYATKTAPADNLVSLLQPASAKTTVRHASSNTLFMRGNLIMLIGAFDECLGVGTPNNGGEDVEYALRAYINARKSRYIPAELVGHRDKIPSLRARYYRGSLLALRRHAPKKFGIRVEYLRKIAVGFALSCLLQMTWKDYFKSLSVKLPPVKSLMTMQRIHNENSKP